MKQLQSISKNLLQRPQSRTFGTVCIAVKSWFHHLDVPVAEFFPDEIIYLLHRNTQLIFVHVFGYIFCQSIYLRQDPFICACKFCKIHFFRNFRFLQVHHDKSGSVPYLIGKVPAGFHSLPVETHIISRGISGDQSKAERIGSILVNHFQGINTVPKRFAHLPALGIPHQSMDQHMVERGLSCLLQTGEDHTDYPEEDNIIAGNQYICWIEVLHLRSLVRPSQGRKGPQCRGKPGIQGILVLMEMSAAAFWTFSGHFPGNYSLSALVAIISRDPVSPPELAGDAPISDILQPMEISLIKSFRNKRKIPFF